MELCHFCHKTFYFIISPIGFTEEEIILAAHSVPEESPKNFQIIKVSTALINFNLNHRNFIREILLPDGKHCFYSHTLDTLHIHQFVSYFFTHFCLAFLLFISVQYIFGYFQLHSISCGTKIRHIRAKNKQNIRIEPNKTWNTCIWL